MLAIGRGRGIHQIGGGRVQIDAAVRAGGSVDQPEGGAPRLHACRRDLAYRKHRAKQKGVPIPIGEPAQEVALSVGGEQVDFHLLRIIDPDLLGVRARPVDQEVTSIRRELKGKYRVRLGLAEARTNWRDDLWCAYRLTRIAPGRARKHKAVGRLKNIIEVSRRSNALDRLPNVTSRLRAGALVAINGRADNYTKNK